MNRKTTILLALGAAFLMGFLLGTREDYLNRNDVMSAQKLIGLSFPAHQVDTMLNYLEKNLEGYDSMRSYAGNLNYDIAPPLSFDPHPANFKFSSEILQIEWPLPEDVSLPEEPDELAFYTVAELSVLLKNRKISSLELTRLYLNRIRKFDGSLQSVITVTEDLALAQARKADKEIANGRYRGPLHGIPYGLKDLFAVKGYQTTWGAAPYKDQILDYDATIVRKLEEAGAVLVAKLTSGALARGDVWFGGKTKNPWDLEQGASGSSAGSGSATSAGLVAFSIGTETLGSIVSPSTRNGVSGLRPTYGTVSRFGGMSLSWTMDKPGPICRSALDCAIVFDAIRGKDPADRTTRDAPFNFQTDITLKDLKIGYLIDLFETDTSDNAVNNQATLETFRSLGAETIAFESPKNVPFDVFDIILRAEAGAFFDDLVLSGLDSIMVQQDKRSRANSLRQSRFIPAVEYLQANRHRAVLIEKMHEIMEEVDILIAPTFGRQLLITNLTGHPAVAIPNGFDEEGHPTSITLLGNLYDEATILTVAYIFQEATDFDEMHPPGF